MAKRGPKWQVGAIRRVPLPDGSFGHARQLELPYVAVYDIRSESAADIDQILRRPILFGAAVLVSSIAAWEVLGVVPLENHLQKLKLVFFDQDSEDYRDCVIWDTAGNERVAKPEKCLGLEPSAVWEAHQVGERILDHFMGRPNQNLEDFKVRLS